MTTRVLGAVANLPNATVVMDHFHAGALANWALDKVRA